MGKLISILIIGVIIYYFRKASREINAIGDEICLCCGDNGNYIIQYITHRFVSWLLFMDDVCICDHCLYGTGINKLSEKIRKKMKYELNKEIKSATEAIMNFRTSHGV
jgi:hypothetical protein